MISKYTSRLQSRKPLVHNGYSNSLAELLESQPQGQEGPLRLSRLVRWPSRMIQGSLAVLISVKSSPAHAGFIFVEIKKVCNNLWTVVCASHRHCPVSSHHNAGHHCISECFVKSQSNKFINQGQQTWDKCWGWESSTSTTQPLLSRFTRLNSQPCGK